MKLALVSVLMSAVFVAACGGGGGDNSVALTPPPSDSPPAGSPPPNSPPPGSPPATPSPPPPNSPIATSPTYEAITYVDARMALTAQANSQGARGFSFYSGLVLDDTPLTPGDQIFTNFYVKEANTTFTYESLDLPTTRQTLLTQLNTQGARGFAWYSGISSGNDQYSLFVKDSSDISITYEFLDETSTAAGFLSQASAQGLRGFLYAGGYVAGGSTFNIYGKVNGSNAQYSYRLESVPTTQATLLDQVSTQGQSGYKFAGGQVFVGEPINSTRIFNAFVKDTAQNASFEWRSVAPATTTATLVAQANAQGLANFRLFGNYGTTSGASTIISTYYFKSNNCSGILCNVNSLL
jgi:hypothetical protein